jgi:hypothetical protein
MNREDSDSVNLLRLARRRHLHNVKNRQKILNDNTFRTKKQPVH